MSRKLNKAMILAAGFGTRLKPLTDKTPKPLVPYKGMPMISHVIKRLTGSGITDITVNAHYFSEQMEDYFRQNDFGVKINLAVEKEILGTGGGIKNARQYLEDCEEFLVYNTDVISDISIAGMYSTHISGNSVATLAVKRPGSSRALIMDAEGRLIGRMSGEGKKIYTATAYSEQHLATFCGIHIISSKIFKHFPPENVFDIISVYMNLVSAGEKIKCFDIKDAFWKDIGRPEAL